MLGCCKTRQMSSPKSSDESKSRDPPGADGTSGTRSGHHGSSYTGSSSKFDSPAMDPKKKIAETEDQSPYNSSKDDSTSVDERTPHFQSGSHASGSTANPLNVYSHSYAPNPARDPKKEYTKDQLPPNSSKEESTQADETAHSQSGAHQSRNTVNDGSPNTDNQSPPNSSTKYFTYADEITRSQSAPYAFRDPVKDSVSNTNNQAPPYSSTTSRHAGDKPSTESGRSESSLTFTQFHNPSTESSTTSAEHEPMEEDPPDYPGSSSKSEDESNSSLHDNQTHQYVVNNEAANTAENRQSNEQDRKKQNHEDVDQSKQRESASDAKEKHKTPSTAASNLSQVQLIEEFESEDDFHQLSISQMKNLLTKASVNFKNFIDRKEYVERLQEVWKATRIELKSDGDACRICRDNPINSVFLECGHMMACVDCAHRIKECPICRYYISRVIRVFQN